MIYFPEHLLLTESLVCLEFFMDRADFAQAASKKNTKQPNIHSNFFLLWLVFLPLSLMYHTYWEYELWIEMHFAHSVNHEIAPVPRQGTQGDTAALMQDTFLLAFRQLLQKICKKKSVRIAGLLLNWGRFLLNAELSSRWHLLCVSCLVISCASFFWTEGDVAYVWCCWGDKGDRITHHTLSASVGSSITQKYRQTSPPPNYILNA